MIDFDYIFVFTGFPLGLGKWEGIFQSGNFEQTGKVRENHTKYWKSSGISDKCSLLPPANEVWGKVMFLHLCVILFTWGGGSVQNTPCRQTWGVMADPPRQTPTPSWIQTPPQGRSPSGYVNNRAVRILLEYILVILSDILMNCVLFAKREKFSVKKNKTLKTYWRSQGILSVCKTLVYST